MLIAALVQAQTAHRNTVDGIQTASTETENISLLLNVEGDLPGTSSVVIRRDGNKVTGGSWRLTVMPPNADAVSREKGQLNGGISAGVLSFNGDGGLTGADSIQLNIQGGTGQYATVKSGSGTIKLSLRLDNPSKLSGTMTLNF
ncbi:MAG TPA: hypothetical protein VMS31_07450 [Pyrinomonadaceae bacterium]|nr:hypothetical protein [Pyrinomonadaceae bacterium]